MKKASVFGHFGFGKNLLNGQTIKTKILSDELIRQFGKNCVNLVDTKGGIKSLIKAPFVCMRELFRSKNIVILPAHNGVRVYGLLLPIFRPFYRKRKLHYVVIGGWLAEFLKKHRVLTRFLKKFDGIYVETNSMKMALEEMGFENTVVMPNCKNLNILKENELVYPDGEPYKLCTFSRVMKQKGIEDAVNAVKAVNEHFGRTVYALDIYGQIDADQTDWFESLKESFPDYVTYGGLVSFDKSTDVLKKYFALLFPTYYEGEGFAGTLIDAFAAGVPVIASDWKYNPEIVADGQLGYVYSLKNDNGLEIVLKQVLDDIEAFCSMKKECLRTAERYLPENVLECMLCRFYD